MWGCLLQQKEQHTYICMSSRCSISLFSAAPLLLLLLLWGPLQHRRSPSC